MSKRFHDTEVWLEDWFLKLPDKYKLFWFWIKDTCDHAGIFKPNTHLFEITLNTKINLTEALILFNTDKERIIVLGNGKWFLSGFIKFQYGKSLNMKNRVHESIAKILTDNDIDLTAFLDEIDLKLTPN